MPFILIVAESFRQSENWIYEHKINKNDCRYIDHPEQLHGFDMRNCIPVYLPGYYNNPWSAHIEDGIRHRRKAIGLE